MDDAHSGQAATNPGESQLPSMSAPITSSEEVWREIKSAPYPTFDVLPEFPEGWQRLVGRVTVAFAVVHRRELHASRTAGTLGSITLTTL
ncbi:hypothetical protein B9Q04_04585 [Candidatus Marsarchaeota G2 archaeon BE_D]|uniref:Uncharacterized protein n=1 Tax=Candidatus Marsarchaeota G2 archaeon BE_D TaxID=1978158 RepID=A0A2R6CCL6_9ARCH|nr:MAG: hypothetical protein B9Q04_04585 [Candidatus Marsarchaeota G2 archaeon BE_D]